MKSWNPYLLHMKHVITGKYAGKRLSKYTIEYLAVSYLCTDLWLILSNTFGCFCKILRIIFIFYYKTMLVLFQYEFSTYTVGISYQNYTWLLRKQLFCSIMYLWRCIRCPHMGKNSVRVMDWWIGHHLKCF